MQVPARRQRAANDNGFPLPIPARCREYGNGNYEALRPLSPVADMSSHTSWSAMGQKRSLASRFREEAAMSVHGPERQCGAPATQPLSGVVRTCRRRR